jgi:hypothetical protein
MREGTHLFATEDWGEVTQRFYLKTSVLPPFPLRAKNKMK